MDYSVHSYSQYHALGTSEGQCLDRNATYDWKCPLADEKKINFNPTNADLFTAILEEQSKLFGYSLLTRRVPTTRIVDAMT